MLTIRARQDKAFALVVSTRQVFAVPIGQQGEADPSGVAADLLCLGTQARNAGGETLWRVQRMTRIGAAGKPAVGMARRSRRSGFAALQSERGDTVHASFLNSLAVTYLSPQLLPIASSTIVPWTSCSIRKPRASGRRSARRACASS